MMIWRNSSSFTDAILVAIPFAIPVRAAAPRIWPANPQQRHGPECGYQERFPEAAAKRRHAGACAGAAGSGGDRCIADHRKSAGPDPVFEAHWRTLARVRADAQFPVEP